MKRITREEFDKIINDIPQYRELLDERQNRLLNLYMKGYNFQQIGDIVKLSRSRVRQIIKGETARGKGGIYLKLVIARRKIIKNKGDISNMSIIKQSDKIILSGEDAKEFKNQVTKVICPKCKNIEKEKKNCQLCNGKGYV